MLTDHAQRWREGRSSYRPAGEHFDPAHFEVAPIADDTTPKAFVKRHHYLGTWPAVRERIGLYERGELVGVAVFSVPVRSAVLHPYEPEEAVELGRFVLLDRVKGNGETWFLARAFEFLRGKYAGVVSFSDPMPRTDAAGKVVFKGHVGTIYQASNAIYVGQARAENIMLLPTGKTFARRALSKIRGGERGWRYAVEALVNAGAPAPQALTPTALTAWVDTVLPQVTRSVKHPGNHKYYLPLRKTGRAERVRLKALAARARPYPKMRIPVEDPKSALTIEFANPEARLHFAKWLCGAGEQLYWDWMTACESEQGGDITATRFHYRIEDTSKAPTDPARYGEFLPDGVIRTTCGRITKPEDDEAE